MDHDLYDGVNKVMVVRYAIEGRSHLLILTDHSSLTFDPTAAPAYTFSRM